MTMTPHIRKAVFEEVSAILGKHDLLHGEVIEILAMAVVSVFAQQPRADDNLATIQTIMSQLNENVAECLRTGILQQLSEHPRLQ